MLTTVKVLPLTLARHTAPVPDSVPLVFAKAHDV